MDDVTALLEGLKCAKVLSKEIDYADYVALDLSVSNKFLKTKKLETAIDYQIFIQEYLNNNNAKIAYGGYKEIRNLYKQNEIFNNSNTYERNIHIGLDLWINASAPVFAALDGKLHSFKNNDLPGDYGPTLILKHNINGINFYTLYGHLSLDSLNNKNIGDEIKQGTQIATLGLPPVNGNYAPHLHFQIIIDIEIKKGDYPGVCNVKDLAYYSKNCPNPNLLLKINRL